MLRNFAVRVNGVGPAIRAGWEFAAWSFYGAFGAASHSNLSFTSSPVVNRPSVVGGSMPYSDIFNGVEPVTLSLPSANFSMLTGIVFVRVLPATVREPVAWNLSAPVAPAADLGFS